MPLVTVLQSQGGGEDVWRCRASGYGVYVTYRAVTGEEFDV